MIKMPKDTTHLDIGTYIVANGAISLFGYTDLKIIGGGHSMEEALTQYTDSDPMGEVIDNNGLVESNHTYLLVILKSKRADYEKRSEK